MTEVYPTPSPGLRVALYCRVSTTAQGRDGTSLDTQEAAARAYAAARGWLVVEPVYRDMHTGGEYRQRPALSALREQLRRGELDVVLAYAIDRVSRNQSHLAILAEEIENHGARLDLVTEDFEDSAVGKFIRQAKGFAAEIEREKIAERTTRGTRARVGAGKPLAGGKPLYGYRWGDAAKSFLVEADDTFPVALRIWQAALGGATLGAIQAELHAGGVPTPTGRAPHWHLSTIRHVLAEPRYMGVYTCYQTETVRTGNQGGSPSVRARRRAVDDPQRVTLPAGVLRRPDGQPSQVVTPAEFAAVQTRLAANKLRATRNARTPQTALLRGGYVRCGLCGRVLCVDAPTATRPTALYRCYGARNGGACAGQSLAVDGLDREVWAAVVRLIEDGDYVEQELARHLSDDGTARELGLVERALGAARRELRQATAVLGEVTNPTALAAMAGALDELGTRVEALEAERTAVLGRQAEWQHWSGRLDALRRVRTGLPAVLDGLAWAEKRALVLDALQVVVLAYPAGAAEAGRWQFYWELPAGVIDDSSVSATGINTPPAPLRLAVAQADARAA